MAFTKTKERRTIDAFDARKMKEIYTLKPHPVTGRLIDNHPGKRTIPMKVLVLGMSRTGTLAIFTALEQLGYTPYHMSKAISAPRSNLTPWVEGLNAKFHGIGRKWGREEFDKLLGEYDAVADVPCVTFAEELIEAYPDAKVLLNNRDVDKWLESMDGTLAEVVRWKAWPYLAPWEPSLARPWWEFANVVMPVTFGTTGDFSPNGPAREAFHRHYAKVREVCPKDRLLEYRVQDGWEPLCAFLEKNVPQTEFPRFNDKEQFIFAHRVMYYVAFGKMFGKISMMAAPIVAIAVAIWQRRALGF